MGERGRVAREGTSSDRPRRGGAALDDASRAKYEARLGVDLGDVHVHTDDASAASLGAVAYTTGTDIHLGPGQGDESLAHELVHIAQAANGEGNASGRDPHDPSEREANELGPRLAAGETVRATASRSTALQLRGTWTDRPGETPIENKEGCMTLQARIARYYAAGASADATYFFTGVEWFRLGGDLRAPWKPPGLPPYSKPSPPQTTMSARDPWTDYPTHSFSENLGTLEDAGVMGTFTMLVAGGLGHSTDRVIREVRTWEGIDAAISTLGKMPDHGYGHEVTEAPVEPRVRNAEPERGPIHGDMPAVGDFETPTVKAREPVAPADEYFARPDPDAEAVRAADRLREATAAAHEATDEVAAAVRAGQRAQVLSANPSPRFVGRAIRFAYALAKKGIRDFSRFRSELAAKNILSSAEYGRLSPEAKEILEAAFRQGLENETIEREFPEKDKTWSVWPPPEPAGPKPTWNEPGGVRYRWDRYRWEKHVENGRRPTAPKDMISDPATYFERYIEPKANGQSPGELGSPEHKAMVMRVRNVNKVNTMTMGEKRPDAVGKPGQDLIVRGTAYSPEPAKKGQPANRVLYEADNFFVDHSQLVSEAREQVRQFRKDNPGATIVVQDVAKPSNIVVYRPGEQPPPEGVLDAGTPNKVPYP